MSDKVIDHQRYFEQIKQQYDWAEGAYTQIYCRIYQAALLDAIRIYMKELLEPNNDLVGITIAKSTIDEMTGRAKRS